MSGDVSTQNAPKGVETSVPGNLVRNPAPGSSSVAMTVWAFVATLVLPCVESVISLS